ncbi:MAG TPA: GntR family transcriptional regulator [Bryobacteraceae bacterium]|nr:GntR family transcriptional regulator [Bryobacteraceae bacterium]
MLLNINMDDRRPLYQQIADGIRTLIASGQLSEGQALPPVRQVAGDLGVNLNTIAVAYRELQDDGLIILKHGSRATVASRTAGKHNEEELRGSLRTALTQLVLAGMPLGRILEMVNDELGSMMKGVKA